MSALDRIRADVLKGGGARAPLRVLAASGQLGYGVLEPAFRAGLARAPHLIGADMGSVDPGPYYLGAGRMATSPIVTKRDLTLLLTGARSIGAPLIIGTAGTAGAAPHLAQTLEIVRDVAREHGLHFRLASIAADIPKDLVKRAVRRHAVRPIGAIADLTDAEIDAAAHIVGQMGCEAFQRALEAGADVVIAGRACDTAIFAAIPAALGYPMGAAMHMAKIIECCSLCCLPGGRDSMLGTLDDGGFTLDSMNPSRAATPMSVAAHSLYEQADPYTVTEPEGTLHVDAARYTALDDHRARVEGARWVPARQLTLKIEGAARVGERAVVLAGTCDPRVIGSIRTVLPGVEAIVRELVPPHPERPYELRFRVYGLDGVVAWPTPPEHPPREAFILGEVLADTPEEAMSVATVTKQYLLHHGFPGRLSTAGNVAFPFTPPELAGTTAYRFCVYHIMDVEALAPLFPVTLEDL
jgi:hypothetical protein